MLAARSLRIQRHIEFLSKLCGAKRAAGKISLAYFQRRDFTLSAIRVEHNRLRRWIFLNIHFVVRNSSLSEEVFGAPAIRAPACGVKGNRVHQTCSAILNRHESAAIHWKPEHRAVCALPGCG